MVEVVVCAPCDGVQVHQILKVSDLPSHPFLDQPRTMQESGRFTDADPGQVGSAQTNDAIVDLAHHLWQWRSHE